MLLRLLLMSLLASALSLASFESHAAEIPVVEEVVALTPSDRLQGGGWGFGASMAMSGDRIVLGAPSDSTLGQQAGAAYVLRRDDAGTPDDLTDDLWIEEDKIVASDGADSFDQFFGTSVSIDGDLLVVGGPGNPNINPNAPAAYVFRREPGGWVEEAKLVSSRFSEDTHFGASVSISGEVIVVGAPTEPLFVDGRGAYVFRRSGTSWVEEAALIGSDTALDDSFGNTVDIDGDVIVVGAPLDDDAGNRSGSAYVFRWDGVNWVEEQKLTALDSGAGHVFGGSVSMEADSLVIGAAGSAYVFQQSENAWIQQQKLSVSSGGRFGRRVALFGDTIVVGAPKTLGISVDGESCQIGAAFVFQRFFDTWHLAAKLTTSAPKCNGNFGSSVTVSAGIALVHGFQDSGTAYVYDIAGVPLPIPAVTTWGLVVLALLTVVAATLLMKRRMLPYHAPIL